MKTIINAKEKWNRMNNPKCLEDYGLSISKSELKMFKEGRKIISFYEERKKELNDMKKVVEVLVESSINTREKIALGVISENM